MTIRLLAKDVVDRIAAGEVIERPASVVKELVENALDAGADRVDVELEDGGMALLRVVDNGGGIPADELPLALASHATSKIRDPEELFHVASLGFRGEALSSIAAVSLTRIRSRTPESDAAAEIESRGGQMGEITPASGAQGTSVEVRDLFFNTPVRRRFLKTPRSEAGRVSEWLGRLALARPDVAFRLLHGGREVFNYPAEDNLAARVKRMYGREIGERLLPVDGRSEAMRLAGFVLPPAVDRADTRWIRLYVNGRFVRDKTWLAAVREAYRGLLMRGRAPVALLFLDVDPGEVDVNVHPTKEEVRFREPSRLFSLTVRSLREALGAVDLRPEITEARVRQAQARDSGTAPPLPFREPSSVVRETSPGAGIAASWPGGAATEPGALAMEGEGARTLDAAWGEGPGRVFQLLRTYLVEERGAGFAVTDQHALHERILFEEMKAKLARGPLAMQRLLVPEVVRVGPRATTRIAAEAETLARLGIRVTPLDGERVVVEGVPEVLRKMNAPAVVEAAAVLLADEDARGGVDALTDDLVATMACRAAVKAGDILREEEIRDLLRAGAAVDRSPFCPHGRPVTVYVAASEIERWFRRKV